MFLFFFAKNQQKTYTFTVQTTQPFINFFFVKIHQTLAGFKSSFLPFPRLKTSFHTLH